MLTRWDPFADMNQLFRPTLVRREATFRPAVDIRETDEAFVVFAELPGLTTEDLNIDVEDGVLRVSGERTLAEGEDREGFRRVERRYGAFSRAFSLPDNVDADAVSAKLEHGVLTLTLPKRDLPGARKIAIEAA